jgi:hypothetical protein
MIAGMKSCSGEVAEGMRKSFLIYARLGVAGAGAWGTPGPSSMLHMDPNAFRSLHVFFCVYHSAGSGESGDGWETAELTPETDRQAIIELRVTNVR